MRKRKILLLTVITLLISMLAGCGNSVTTTNTTKVKKIALTEENIQKVFVDKYEVGVNTILDEHKSIDAIFKPKENIKKKEARSALKEIENTLHKNFDIANDNSIEISYNGNTIIKSDGVKIQIGGAPNIEVGQTYGFHYYSMATKFNLINPADGVQVSAKDDEDGDITSKMKLKNPEVLTKTGKQNLIYEVTDSDGNTVTCDDLKVEITK